MQPVYAIASNITTSIGLSTTSVWDAITSGQTGVRRQEDAALCNHPFWASRLSEEQWQQIRAATKDSTDLTGFEQMALYSVRKALSELTVPIDLDDTVLVLASTKGNIEGLGTGSDDRNLLTTSAGMIARAAGIRATPLVISHACVSGVTALLYGLRLLQAGRYKHAIVVGADRFTKFVLSGFQSFQAIADGPCRPFDRARKGINLGEAAATIVLSTAAEKPLARLCSGATSNDANHISGPSRTGAELAMAISRSLEDAGITADKVGMISAHGTATVYNDEMESKAFALAGLLQSPVHSLKGYVGHTLGAAGILESIMCIAALQHQQLIPSIGFSELGVPENIKVTTSLEDASFNYVLKTASGFGGCNAVALWMYC
jgi:3-oxoacyl-[acyl-carrier-protein] synthase-1